MIVPTTARGELLATGFMHSYTAKEWATLIGYSVSATRRALNKLCDDNLFRRQWTGSNTLSYKRRRSY